MPAHEFLFNSRLIFAGTLTIAAGNYAAGDAANTVDFAINGVTANAVVNWSAKNFYGANVPVLFATVPTPGILRFTFDDVNLAGGDGTFHVTVFEPNN